MPFLRFEGYDWVDKSGIEVVKVRLYFTDGNGDVGLNNDQLNPPFDLGSPYYYNLWVKYYERTDSGWTEVNTALPYSARLPNLTPNGQNKTLEATIEYDLDPSQAISDSVKFSFILLDRALNLSNEVFSNAIYVAP